MIKIKNKSFSYILFYLFGISIALIITNCSDLKNNIPAAPQVTVHKPGILVKTSPDWHGTLVKDKNWNLEYCQQCHAVDFSGGVAGVSCLNCHKNSGGPGACNTCHGDFRNINRIAPPRDINGDTSTTVMGVGAHTLHLYESTLGNNVECSNCHIKPDKFNSPGHIGGLPVKVVLSGQAISHGAINALYNHADGSCSNTYCHGNFTFYKDSADLNKQYAFTADKMTGNSKTVIWNKVDGSQIECGSCHGLPPAGHIQVPLKDCIGCHRGVVDENGNIIDKTKHINGKIDVLGE